VRTPRPTHEIPNDDGQTATTRHVIARPEGQSGSIGPWDRAEMDQWLMGVPPIQIREGIRQRPGCLRAPGECGPGLRAPRPGRTDGIHADSRDPTQRNLNNAFAYDLVPSPSVCTAALRAARRVNDFPTAVRIFEGMPAEHKLDFATNISIG